MVAHALGLIHRPFCHAESKEVVSRSTWHRAPSPRSCSQRSKESLGSRLGSGCTVVELGRIGTFGKPQRSNVDPLQDICPYNRELEVVFLWRIFLGTIV